jgi:hypothetical protein
MARPEAGCSGRGITGDFESLSRQKESRRRSPCQMRGRCGILHRNGCCLRAVVSDVQLTLITSLDLARSDSELIPTTVYVSQRSRSTHYLLRGDKFFQDDFYYSKERLSSSSAICFASQPQFQDHGAQFQSSTPHPSLPLPLAVNPKIPFHDYSSELQQQSTCRPVGALIPYPPLPPYRAR